MPLRPRKLPDFIPGNATTRHKIYTILSCERNYLHQAIKAQQKAHHNPKNLPISSTPILAEEITTDLKNDPELLSEIIDFSLSSTDDGADEDFVPEHFPERPLCFRNQRPPSPIQRKRRSPLIRSKKQKKYQVLQNRSRRHQFTYTTSTSTEVEVVSR